MFTESVLSGAQTSPPFHPFSAGRYLTTKEQFHEFLEARGQEQSSGKTKAGDPGGHDPAGSEAKRIRLEDGDGQTEEAAEYTEQPAEYTEQPQAQKRARGQNKGRPHLKPKHYDKNRLCPSLVQVSVTVTSKSQRSSV